MWRRHVRTLCLALIVGLTALTIASWSSGGTAWALGGAPAPLLGCPTCNDFNVCTTDTCDPATGTCHNVPIDCDDRNPCTRDTVVPGGCTHTPLAAGTACDDGNSCTLGDTCNDAGACVGQTQPAGTACNDGDPCTAGDACNDAGICAGMSVEAGAACDDGDLCTTGDTCALSATGALVCRGVAKDCSDANGCTEDSCDPSTGQCVHRECPSTACDIRACVFMNQDHCVDAVIARDGTPCDDGNACTVDDVCRSGQCHGVPPGCDDGNPCTVDYINDSTGECVHNPSPGLTCDDGNPCTVGDACQFNGTCVGTPACDDGNPCTTDLCDPQTLACSHVNGPDSDGDGVPDACDNCPTVPNPDQNICACAECIPVEITISFNIYYGKGSGLLSWRTGIEHDVLGFNVVVFDNKGNRTQLNSVLIPCEECVTDVGHTYLYIILKHKSGQNIFVEQVRQNGTVQLFGPAVRL